MSSSAIENLISGAQAMTESELGSARGLEKGLSLVSQARPYLYVVASFLSV